MKVVLMKLVLSILGIYSLSVGNAKAEVTEGERVAKTVLISLQPSNTSNEQRIKTQDRPKTIGKIFARSTFYNRDEAKVDYDTKKHKTSSLVKLTTLEDLELNAVAVDPSIIPYGSAIITSHGQVFIAVDTGSDVKSRRAAIDSADLQGLSKTSKESRAPVLDFYSDGQVGQPWDDFKMVRYEGDIPFKDLPPAEKLEYLRTLSKVLKENPVTSKPL